MSALETDLAELRSMLATALQRIDDRPRETKAYKIPEVGRVLGVDTKIVYAMIRAGELPTITLPTMTAKRVPVAAVDALVASDRWELPSAPSSSPAAPSGPLPQIVDGGPGSSP